MAFFIIIIIPLYSLFIFTASKKQAHPGHTAWFKLNKAFLESIN